MVNPDSLISVCVVTHNQRQSMETLLEQLTRVLSALYQYYEIIVLDNASSDGTDKAIAARLRERANTRLIRLSRLYSLDTAVTAALDNAIGDYVILLDFETAPDVVKRLVDKAEEGFDIVVVRRDLTRLYSPLDRWAGKRLYQLASRMVNDEIVPEDGFTRLFSRRVVNALTQVRRRRRALRHFSGVVGYRQAFITVEGVAPLIGYRRLEKMGSLWSLIVDNSIVPLRFAALLGLAASFINLLYLVYIFAVTVVREGRLAEGWLTTSVSTTVMFFLLFVILAILAEYIGRLLEEAKDEPLYFVEYEEHSTVSSYTRTIEAEKLNIVQF